MKIIKNPVFMFILGVVTCTITTVLASTLIATNISYTPQDKTWGVTNVGAALDSLMLSKTSDNYSTDEKVVGTWIDGKPLYQKTIIFESPNVTKDGVDSEKYIQLNSSIDYSNVVSVNQSSGSSFANVPLTLWVTDETTSPKKVRVSWSAIIFNNQHPTLANKIRFQCNDTALNGHTIYLTIQYTKTTD